MAHFRWMVQLAIGGYGNNSGDPFPFPHFTPLSGTPLLDWPREKYGAKCEQRETAKNKKNIKINRKPCTRIHSHTKKVRLHTF